MDVRNEHLNLGEWNALIERCLAEPDSEPILNLEPDEDPEYDAIFVGGGAGGRFGASYIRAMAGRPLIVDSWPFLGGSCPHQACVPHHLFSEAAEELDRMRWFSFPARKDRPGVVRVTRRLQLHSLQPRRAP